MALNSRPSRRLTARIAASLTAFLLAGVATAQTMPVVEPFARDFDADVFLVGGQAFSVDLETLRAMPAEGEMLIAAFPVSAKISADLLVHRIVPRAEGATFVVVDKFGREIPVAQPETHFFGGSIVGVEGSSVFISVTAAGVFGWIQTDDDQGAWRYVITTGPYGQQHAPAVFDMYSEEFQAIKFEPFICEALMPADGDHGNGEEAVPADASNTSSMLPNCRSIEMAIDTDQEFLAKFNGNTAAALGYVQTMVAGGDEIYRRDASIQLRLAYSRFWTTSDPWTATSTSAELTAFRNYWLANMSSVNRDVAHLFSARSLGGGIAWLNAICTTNGYAVDANMSGSFPTPLVNNGGGNWDIIVWTHELGHNCGTPHTHDLCPPVDSCAPSGYFGSCQTSQVCTSSGTIMSYCHLCNGGTANIVLSFHPNCVARINSYMAGASCASVVTCTSNPACVLTISSAAGNFGVSGGTATVTVSTIGTGCAWTPLSVPSWITLTNGGPASGNGTFSYTVAANTGPTARTYAIPVGDLVHVVTQAAFYDCNSNGTNDANEIAANPALDCDGDGILNACEIASGAADCDANGVPDSCQVTTPVAAWGAGTAGTTGDPNYGQSTIPTGLGSVKAVAAGTYHSLALRSTGSVVAWGRNLFGQTTVPAGLTGVVAVAGGSNHSVALTNAGSVVCWGLNDSGQCSPPVTLGICTKISAGNTHSMALKQDGTVACWGDDTLGQSTPPAGLTGVTGIAAGLVHSLALRSVGTVAGWGQDSYGQATPPAGLTTVTSIGAGAAHSVALRTDGTIAVWGNNTFGQTNVPANLPAVQKIFVGGYATVALLNSGAAVTWGRNDAGQLNIPEVLPPTTMFALGGYHMLHVGTLSALGDCDSDGIADACEIASGAADTNHNGIPDACETVPADINGDGSVNGGDLALLLGAWGTTNAAADINHDGIVDAADMAILLGAWN